MSRIQSSIPFLALLGVAVAPGVAKSDVPSLFAEAQLPTPSQADLACGVMPECPGFADPTSDSIDDYRWERADGRLFFLITSAAALEDLAWRFQDEDQGGEIAGATFVLTTDLDASELDLAGGIGSPLVPFSGDFRGMGCEISGASVYTNDDWSDFDHEDRGTGLFGVVDGGLRRSDAQIHDLRVVDAWVLGGDSPTGAVVGNLRTGVVTNVDVESSADRVFLGTPSELATTRVSGFSDVGGLVGTADDAILRRVQFHGYHRSFDVTDAAHASRDGGLIGVATSTQVETAVVRTLMRSGFAGSHVGGLIGASQNVLLKGVVVAGDNSSGGRFIYAHQWGDGGRSPLLGRVDGYAYLQDVVIGNRLRNTLAGADVGFVAGQLGAGARLVDGESQYGLGAGVATHGGACQACDDVQGAQVEGESGFFSIDHPIYTSINAACEEPMLVPHVESTSVSLELVVLPDGSVDILLEPAAATATYPRLEL